MATPSLTRHPLSGTLGELLVDVRAANRSIVAPVVVLVHGFKGFKDWGFFPPLAERLARAGFSVVSYNASGSGVDDGGEFAYPERFGRNTFTSERRDLERVLAAVDDGSLGIRRPHSIGLVGHSRGGGMAILATVGNPRIGALVTWAAISTPDRWSDELKRRWRETGFLEIRNQRTGQVIPLYPDILDDIEQHRSELDILGAAARITVPWLALHGALDETVPLREGEQLAASAGRLEFKVIEKTGHTFGTVHPFAGMTPALAELFDLTVGFLSRRLP
jgi:pimeloyl-ACP methyl ester carboxylesterase